MFKNEIKSKVINVIKVIKMKFIGTTLHFVTRTNEQAGLWTEKIVCDVLGITFQSNRKFFNDYNYPLKLKDDITALKPKLENICITEHSGNKNLYYDFKTLSGSTVSLKTNTSGHKVCPQNIGQVSLKKFAEKICNENIKTKLDYKQFVLSNLQSVIDTYLENLFCCEHILYIVYDEGMLCHFKKKGQATIILNNLQLQTSKNIEDWNESMSVSIELNDNKYCLCEFQVHNNRDCVKARFNMKTISMLIENGLISNVTMDIFNLKHRYNIKVSKQHYENENTIKM